MMKVSHVPDVLKLMATFQADERMEMNAAIESNFA